MRIIHNNCPFCSKETRQNAVVDSWLDVSGLTIFISYWTRCLECGINVTNKTKEIESEQLK